MRPAFSKALYYPHIDIRDSDWLKTAVLFWDSISTIVPESVQQPYKHRDTEYLADIGFLEPIPVRSDSEYVVGIENEIIEAMFTPQFFDLLTNPRHMRQEGIFHDKISYRLREMFEEIREGMYADKISHGIRDILRDFRDVLYYDGQYFFDDSFAYMYMVTLANKICEIDSIAMVASETQSENFANLLRLGNQSPLLLGRDNGRVFRRLRDFRRERHFEQGVMLDLIIEGLRISPNVPLSDIVCFKKRHKDELGAFRTRLGELVNDLPQGESLKATQQIVKDAYVKFEYEYNNLTKALDSSRIKWFADNLVKISAISASATGIPIMLGATVPQALLALAGVSIMASVVSYNVDKRQRLRDNPYTYLLATQRDLI